MLIIIYDFITHNFQDDIVYGFATAIEGVSKCCAIIETIRKQLRILFHSQNFVVPKGSRS